VTADALAELSALVGPPWVLRSGADRAVYAQDGNTLFAGDAAAVVLPADRDQTVAVLRVLARHGLAVTARGAGTGLSGGATPPPGGVVVCLSRQDRLLALDPAGRRALVEPGLVNARLSAAAAPHGLRYAPDPSSQSACTLGGNLAENSGGAHCLKYGVTSPHVLAAEWVMADGQAVWLGDPAGDAPGLDLRGLFIGSEGTLGVVTRAWLRLVPEPEAVVTQLALFDDEAAAADAVSAVIAAGVTPAAVEMMDALAITAVERGVHPVGFPAGLAATVLVEVDGPAVDAAEEAAEVEAILRRAGPRSVRRAASAAERDLWWANRKTAFGSMGKIAPAYYVQDGVIPRSALSAVLAEVRAIAADHGLRVANVFHAGDGNLHPLVAFDPAEPGVAERVMACGSAMLAACVRAGGSISGEHGVGLEKRAEMRLMYGEDDLALMRRVKAALDPEGRMNPGKLLP
jgi:glycolate oxidase